MGPFERNASGNLCGPPNPIGESIEEGFHERLGLRIGETAITTEHLTGMAEIGLWLLECRHVEEDQRLAQMAIGAEGAESH